MAERVLVLTAHPDDAEIFAGGTIARLADGGARVVVLIATDGRKGSFDHDAEELARIRAEEARRAAAVLGADPPVLLGYPDMEADRAAPGVLREQFIRAIRKLRPDAAICEDPFARDLHPDHRAVAQAAAEAIAYASLPLVHPEHLAQGLQPHYVVEKYYYHADPGPAIRVMDITATMERKLAALAEHHSQVVFLVESQRRQMAMAGLDWRAILGAVVDDPMAVMAARLRASAAEVGRSIGAAYGEAFRYERFSPSIERLLAQQQ